MWCRGLWTLRLCGKQAEVRRVASGEGAVAICKCRVCVSGSGGESITLALRAWLGTTFHPEPCPAFSGDPADPMLRVPGLFSSGKLRDFAAYAIKRKQMSGFFCSRLGEHWGDGHEYLAMARLAVKHGKMNTWGNPSTKKAVRKSNICFISNTCIIIHTHTSTKKA